MNEQSPVTAGVGQVDHRRIIDTIRTLSMDAVEKANSGHPGTAMAMAPVAYVLWSEFLRYDPQQPLWPNRDRFVLSIGHASMLLYSLLHLANVRETDAQGQPTGAPAVSLEDIRNFRQADSKTPGHPEYRFTTGVETTTGPLGQGCGNSVGMAIAERALAARFNRDDAALFDHDVYVMCGDGDLMEGVSAEAASIAGHLKLSNLCWIYDSNSISIEGSTDLAFTEDVGARFLAYGWNVLTVDDANDLDAIRSAFTTFRETSDRPTLVIVRSVIGWGSPKAGSEKAHGEPLGADAIRATKRAYDWPEDASFLVEPGIGEQFEAAMQANGGAVRSEWEATFDEYRSREPKLAAELDRLLVGELPEGWDLELPVFPADAKGLASRDAGGKALNAIALKVPELMGGSADLAPSTKTLLTFAGAGSFTPSSPEGRNFHFGVREHAMGSIANGMALSYLRAYAATFLVFADYMRAPIRLAAIMELPVVFVFTHDSIGVGEDGPTHQPIEHLASLRAIPGLNVVRPADANEVTAAWANAMRQTHTPTALILSRQALPTIDRTRFADAALLERGAYVLAGETDIEPELILMATGSEVSLALAVHEELEATGIRSRVVSMPSWHLFELQDQAYRDAVLPPQVVSRVAIEQAGAFGWAQYVGLQGETVTMRTFGASAPLAKLQDKYGFTHGNVAAVARALVERNRK